MTYTTIDAVERRRHLREIALEHGLRVFIETGTHTGDTPAFLLDDFDQIFTIELGRQAWRKARIRFARSPHVHCLFGDSAEVLPQVLEQVGNVPALIWLDGHHSGGDTAQGPKDTPVLEELEAIFAHRVPHVIVVDDARLFEGTDYDGPRDHADWPHIDTVTGMAEAAGYRHEVIDDMLHLMPT